MVFWRYRNDVTFAVVGKHSFIWSRKPSVKSWYPLFGNPTNYGLDFTKFLVESVEFVDPELECLQSIVVVPSKPLRDGTTFRIVVDDDEAFQV